MGLEALVSFVCLLHFVSMATATQSESCNEFGNDVTLDGGGDFLSGLFFLTDSPASCSGILTSWHYCFYDNVPDSGYAYAKFGIYRKNSTSQYCLVYSEDQIQDTLTTVNRPPHECRSFTPSQSNFQVEPGDIIAVCMPGTTGMDALPLLGLGRADGEAYRLEYESNSDCIPTLIDSIDTVGINNLEIIHGGVVHVYADINECLISGYERSEDGLSCNDINECLLMNGNCSQICNNTLGSYTCDCNPGYELDGDGFSCNECLLNCSQICNNTLGSYTCGCNPGYELDGDGLSCNDINECSVLNGGCEDTCMNTVGSFECSCSTVGHQVHENGINCIDTNECLLTNGNCSQICNNTLGSYTCDCNPGYELDEDGFSCNECLLNCSQICNNTLGSYTCGCNPGYELDGDGLSCNDINECSVLNGGCEDTCMNTVGSFECSCSTVGHQVHENGINCIDINECLLMNGNCSQICNNTLGSYACDCNPGYELDGDGFSCNDINECLLMNGNCSQICNNTLGSYTCDCNPGYELDGDGFSCNDLSSVDLPLVIGSTVAAGVVGVVAVVAAIAVFAVTHKDNIAVACCISCFCFLCMKCKIKKRTPPYKDIELGEKLPHSESGYSLSDIAEELELADKVTLKPCSLDELFDALEQTKLKWREIAKQLKFSYDRITEITRTNGLHDDADFFQEMLKIWFRREPKDTTLKILVCALHSAKQYRASKELLQKFNN